MKEACMKLYLEIRAGEGGDDAKLLIGRQGRMYLCFAKKAGVKAEIVQDCNS